MNARVMALLISIAVALLLTGCWSNDQPVSDATTSAEIDATAVPGEVSALIDDWFAALERGDGSALDLYVSEGYHLYGDKRFDHDQILGHLQGGGLEHEWITEPLLVAEDEDGRYVAVRGMRISSPSVWSNASALLFEIVTTADGDLRLAQTAWFYDSEWSP